MPPRPKHATSRSNAHSGKPARESPGLRRRRTALWYPLLMNSAVKLMPNPRELARDFTNPFVYVLGGFALFLSVIYLMVG